MRVRGLMESDLTDLQDSSGKLDPSEVFQLIKEIGETSSMQEVEQIIDEVSPGFRCLMANLLSHFCLFHGAIRLTPTRTTRLIFKSSWPCSLASEEAVRKVPIHADSRQL